MKRVRIEFDSITDVPDIWIDGEQVIDSKQVPDKTMNNGLVSMDLHWKTNDYRVRDKIFDLKWLTNDGSRGGLHQESFGQRTPE
ncbi:hypothetical protein EFT87_04060 [Schleiferilactobacillus harbinensis]|uniref:hypothetical protein n=1 Tax=Schleiferilactobacillus harbinensis TaxID=304207 RepID=UPI0021A67158|nr:hypothetical protein [Schleiferilactobacillus harbinensis]MCT2907835.1 hypothetical protein [Schleiferilactobacillus harbinensis]